MNSTYSRGAILLAQMLEKAHKGEYTDAKTPSHRKTHLSETILGKMHVETLGQFAKDMDEVTKAMRANEAVVGVTSAAAPKAGLR